MFKILSDYMYLICCGIWLFNSCYCLYLSKKTQKQLDIIETYHYLIKRTEIINEFKAYQDKLIQANLQ